MTDVVITLVSGVMGVVFGVGLFQIITRAEHRRTVAVNVFALSFAWLAYIFILFLVVPS